MKMIRCTGSSTAIISRPMRSWRRQCFSVLLLGCMGTSVTFAQAPTRLPRVSSSPSVELAEASKRQHESAQGNATLRTKEVGQIITNQSSTRSDHWLRSTTSDSSTEIARRLIAQANAEYNAHAWLSAETTAWDAIRHASIAIDNAERGSQSDSHIIGSGSVQGRSVGAESNLEIAKQAIIEARDFASVQGTNDNSAVARISRGHRTRIFSVETAIGLSPGDASDRYLDHARVHLAAITEQSVDAAQGLDLLAAIYLGRADAKTLPSGTALCLRRAALQGQPSNASLASRLGMHLAEVGLMDEAKWALQHSLSLEYDPRSAVALADVMRRTGDIGSADQLIAVVQQRSGGTIEKPAAPEIVQLSPSEFASVSKPVMPANSTSSDPQTQPASVPAMLASSRSGTSNTQIPSAQVLAPESPIQNIVGDDDGQTKPPGKVRRFFKSLKPNW